MYGIFMKAGSFIKTGIIKKVSPNYFTGKASLQIISGTPKPKEADVLHVKFHKGARTKIHAHTSGQMLIVTGGTGSLITYSGIVIVNTGKRNLDHPNDSKTYRMHWIANSWKAMAPKSWQQRKQKNMKFLKLMQ